MKRSLLYIGTIFSAVFCSRNDFHIQHGDLLFQVSEPTPMANAISDATGDPGTENFTHVAIVLTLNGADSVLEASPQGGVRIVSLAKFLESSARIGGKPGVAVMRLRDTSGLANSIARASRHLGEAYDFTYRPANGKMYCSELVYESYLSSDGSPLFRAQPMNFRAADGTLPRFWQELFERFGEEVPEGVLGTNPNDMAKEQVLKPVHSYFRRITPHSHE